MKLANRLFLVRTRKPLYLAAALSAALTATGARAATVFEKDGFNLDLYGIIDVGVGWVSHGLPENGYNYEGESLVNRNGNHSQFLIAPNNLSQTGLGIRGKEELAPGWFGVFNASTGINPQSGQLANTGGHQHQQRRPAEEELLVRRRRRARRPALQRRVSMSASRRRSTAR